jgi:hypothetical protein
MNRWWIVAALLMVDRTGLAWSAGPPCLEADAPEQGFTAFWEPGPFSISSDQVDRPPATLQPDWIDARPASQPTWTTSAQVAVPPEAVANLVDCLVEHKQYDQAYICCSLIHHRYPERNWQTWAVHKARAILKLVWNPPSSNLPSSGVYSEYPGVAIEGWGGVGYYWIRTPPRNLWESYDDKFHFFHNMARRYPMAAFLDADLLDPVYLDPVRVLSAAEVCADSGEWKPPYLIPVVEKDGSLSLCQISLCLDRVTFDTRNPRQVSSTVLIRYDSKTVLPPPEEQTWGWGAGFIRY